MRKSMLLVIAVIGTFFVSCTNPNLQNSEETKIVRETDRADQSSSETNDEEIRDIKLDPVGSGPIQIPDSTTNDDDMTVAVDDYIWRELSIAQEYYTMGVVANSRWFEDIAGNEMAALAMGMPAEIVAATKGRARTIDSWETADKLLVELEELGWGNAGQQISNATTGV